MKNWLKRNKPIWIGGLIGLIIGYFLFKNVKSGIMFDLIISLSSLGSKIGRELYLCNSLACLFYGIIFSLIPFVIIGALIGLIIQKVRKK